MRKILDTIGDLKNTGAYRKRDIIFNLNGHSEYFLHVKCTIKCNSVYSDKKKNKQKFLIKKNLTGDRLRGETDKKQAM